MIQIVKAVIGEQGVQLLQSVCLSQTRRALVTILEESPLATVSETALLSVVSRRLEQTGGLSVVAPANGAVVLVRFPFSYLKCI